MSVVPPPMSIRTMPSSFSSGNSTASAEAIGSSTTSCTARPARFTERTTFWIDVTAAVYEFRDRIFHVHAKDVSVDLAKLKRVGYNGDGWWRYTLPGYGRILWGDFITTLRKIGYNGVLSIEHEDGAFPAEEGFVKAARYLNTLV